jgi:enoyl-CoA hydratase/carnithine racemase
LRRLPDLYGDREVLEVAAHDLPRLPAIERALGELAAMADATPAGAATLHFDLAELRGYHYHSGVVFAAYTAGHATAIAAGGRYDEVGRAFGRARPATGFSLDLRELAALDAVSAMRRRAPELLRPVAECRKPVIAAINGFALGGGLELALACDIVVVGEGAKLGLPEVRVGVMPGAGGTQRLPRAVGKHKAMLHALTGRFMSGLEAERMGLASLAVPDAEVLATALALAEEIAALPPIGVQSIKEAILRGADQPLDAALAFERRSFQMLFATEDRREGIAAFLEKRKPVFTGR